MLQSPMRYCELIPIVLFWIEMKHFVAYRNTALKMKDVLDLTNEAIQSIYVEVRQDVQIMYCPL